MSETAELKPCPFCGEIPKYYQYRNEWCVECRSDKCWVVPETDLCSSKEEATEKWNARTPIAEVVEVKRGEWIKKFKYSYGYVDYYNTECSLCGYKAEKSGVENKLSLDNFCPNCGADMRGDGK